MIHYHGTPCGGKRAEAADFLRGRHALVPWVRDEDIGCVADNCQSFCLDNGAFSAWKSGKPITDWTEYFRWAEHWLSHPGCDFAIIPDVIDGDEAANDALLAKWHQKVKGKVWLRGAPVWHMHESLERLVKLCRHYDRVCVGSSGQWSRPGSTGWWHRIGEAMEVCCDAEGRPLAKLHGLRMLDPAIFHRLPLASADSTNATQNSASVKRFGIYCPPNGSQRMASIASRIEVHNSAAVWKPLESQPTLAFMGVDHS